MSQQPQLNPAPTPTTPSDPPSQTSSTPPPASELLLQQLLSALGPTLEFHKAVEEASENDLRLFWDIRLVQGKDTPFTALSGSSTFPGVLVGTALAALPNMIYREIVEKVAMPLNARIHDMTSANALAAVARNVPVHNPPASMPRRLEAPDPSSPQGGHAAGNLTSSDLIRPDERTEAIDALLPAEVLDDAVAILNEIETDK